MYLNYRIEYINDHITTPKYSRREYNFVMYCFQMSYQYVSERVVTQAFLHH